MSSFIESVFLNEKVVLFTLLNVSDKLGILCDIFDLILDRGVNLLMILMSNIGGGYVGFNFLVQESEKNLMKEVALEIIERMGGGSLQIEENVALLVFTGKNLARTKGVAARLYDSFAQGGIKFLSTSSSHHSISGVIPRDRVPDAQQILNEHFGVAIEDVF